MEDMVINYNGAYAGKKVLVTGNTGHHIDIFGSHLKRKLRTIIITGNVF